MNKNKKSSFIFFIIIIINEFSSFYITVKFIFISFLDLTVQYLCYLIIHFSQSKTNQSKYKQLAIVALETFNQAFLIKNSSPFLSGGVLITFICLFNTTVYLITTILWLKSYIFFGITLEIRKNLTSFRKIDV